MPKIRDYYLNLQNKETSQLTQQREPNELKPEFKYAETETFFNDRDVGAKGDPVPQGYIVIDAYGTEFLLKPKHLRDKNAMKNIKIQEYLKRMANRHQSRTMYLIVSKSNKVCVYDWLSAEHIINPETITIDGTTIIMEKNIYDINNKDDIIKLKELVKRFQSQRIVLYPLTKTAIDDCIRHGNESDIGYNPE